MKILIYGAGIQGSYLAHSLIKNKENEVTMLARGKRKQDLEEVGIVLTHNVQRKTTKDAVRVSEFLQPDEYFDLIFVTMKYSDFDSVIGILAENVSRNIIFVGNQVDTKQLAEKFAKSSQYPKKIFFGFQNTGGARKNQEMTVLRFGKGNMKIGSVDGQITIGKALDKAFEGTDYSWREDSDLDNWLKSHAALIMVMNSLDYIFDNNAKEIRRSKEMRGVAAKAYGEAFAILEKNGYKVKPALQKKVFGNAGLTKILLRLLYLTPVMGMAEGNFAEISAIISTFNEYKLRVQVNTPNLDRLTEAALVKYHS